AGGALGLWWSWMVGDWSRGAYALAWASWSWEETAIPAMPGETTPQSVTTAKSGEKTRMPFAPHERLAASNGEPPQLPAPRGSIVTATDRIARETGKRCARLTLGHNSQPQDRSCLLRVWSAKRATPL